MGTNKLQRVKAVLSRLNTCAQTYSSRKHVMAMQYICCDSFSMKKEEFLTCIKWPTLSHLFPPKPIETLIIET
jgi:hypothetical protein